VVAAAVVLDLRRLPAALAGLDDSKRLTAARREDFAAVLKTCAVIGIGAASVAEIDRLNILQASLLAMRRALAALPLPPDAALVDGNRAPAGLAFPALTLVKGDSLSLSIAAASIVAKVVRDRAMAQLDRRYPGYGWCRNAGYGTAEHLAALISLGPTPHHRHSFAPVRACQGAITAGV
jgi:ribonuclease HII